MKFCSRCDYSNLDAATQCLRCGQSLVIHLPPPLPVLPAAQPRIRPTVLYAMIAAISGSILGLAFWIEYGAFRRVQARLASELTALSQAHDAEVATAESEARLRAAAEESAHQKQLNDERLLSGSAAWERREQEWRRRLDQEPSLATTVLETNLLRMEHWGNDPALAPRAALEQVALLASPRGSSVIVSNLADRFFVRVAFKMSEMTAGEVGAVTKHHTVASMRREVEELSARLIKQLFDYCGSRNIDVLSVSCNHTLRRRGIPSAATAMERDELLRRAGAVMGKIYRVSVDARQAAGVAHWREISVPRVIAMMRVEFDGVQDMDIHSYGSPSDLQDANMPLEF
jgi:hypothetical protein